MLCTELRTYPVDLDHGVFEFSLQAVLGLLELAGARLRRLHLLLHVLQLGEELALHLLHLLGPAQTRQIQTNSGIAGLW